MLYHLELSPAVESVLIAPTEQHYVHFTVEMLRSAEFGTAMAPLPLSLLPSSDLAPALSVVDLRREVCRHSDKLFNQLDTLQDWNRFLANAI